MPSVFVFVHFSQICKHNEDKQALVNTDFKMFEFTYTQTAYFLIK